MGLLYPSSLIKRFHLSDMTPETNFTDEPTEQLVLSCAFVPIKEVVQEVIQAVDVSLFEFPNHRELFNAAVTYYMEFHGVLDERGLEMILDRSRADNEKKTRFNLLYQTLKAKAMEVPQAQFKQSLQALKSLKQKRKLYDVARRISEGIHDPAANMDTLTGLVVDKVLDLGETSASVSYEGSLKDTLDLRVAEYADRKANPDKYKGIPFGISKLDMLTGGVLPQELVCFFGAAATGKSRTLASIAYNMFNSGRRILYCTIEMPHQQVGRMFDSHHFFISSAGLRHGNLTSEDEAKYFSKTPTLSNRQGDFYVVDAPQGVSYATLLPVIRKYKSRNRLDAVVIDYLNLMEPVARVEGSEPLKIGTIAKELKQLARLEKVAVLTATQAVRSVAKVEDIEKIGTEHVGWSNLLSYQCDLMIFLMKQTGIRMAEGKMDASIIKNRDGGNAKLELGVDWDKSWCGDYLDLLKARGSFTQ